jgi:hypothetical protein
MNSIARESNDVGGLLAGTMLHLKHNDALIRRNHRDGSVTGSILTNEQSINTWRYPSLQAFLIALQK